MKNLKYFMRDRKDEIVTVPGPESFKDENGNVLNLEIKVLSQAEIQHINDNYKVKDIVTDKKGNILVNNGTAVWKEDRDTAKASRHMIVEALQYPNLKDTELMKYYECVDVTDMPMLVFSKPSEYAHVAKAVMTALGLLEPEDIESVIKEAKN